MLNVSMPPVRVWDCHICGAPQAITSPVQSCTTVPWPDGSVTGGHYHDDGSLCRWIERPGQARRPALKGE